MAPSSPFVPELLAPAGSVDALAAVVACGADAVYLGLKDFNARLRGANFAYAQCEAAVKQLHKTKRRAYITVNTVWTEREADRLFQLLKYISDIGADAVIAQDFGTINIIKTYFPQLKIHASTQAASASAAACNALSKNGVSRTVLARELSFDEIKKIRERTNCELEIFVHGALCVSASGLCLFSSYLGGKSANRGMCTQACRRRYTAEDEAKFYFSPADLSLIDKIPEIAEAGINSFKIEGRMKSAEYAGAVVSAYRVTLDALGSGEAEAEAARKKARDILSNDFARDKTLFHFEGDRGAGFLRPDADGGTGIFLGVISKTKGRGDSVTAFIEGAPLVPDNGDSIRLQRADDGDRKPHKPRRVEAKSKSSFWCDIPEGFRSGDSVYLIQTKNAQRPPPVLPDDLSPFRRKPGFDKCPEAVFNMTKSPFLPEGIYAAVSRVDDFYIVQSVRPERVILNADLFNLNKLLHPEKPLPFKAGEVLISLDPFCSEDLFEKTGRLVEELIGRGYRNYIINNIAHTAFFKNTSFQTTIVAGPYLYCFNRHAAQFILRYARALVSPLENSRQNLEKTFSQKERAHVFVTVFAYPALFRIRSDLRGSYRFGAFHGSRGEDFILTSCGDESLVTPKIPFSITDKISFLREAGFRRFIADFSPSAVQKFFYKDVMRAVEDGRPVPGASRFNWKNGFWAPAPEAPPPVKEPPRTFVRA